MGFFVRHAYDIGFGLGRILWPFLAGRRRVAVENVLRGGVASDRREARRIARTSFAHFLGHVAEALCAPSVITRENWRDHLDCTGAHPELVRLLTEPPAEPILIVSAHLGAWEVATNLLSLVRPMYAVARVQNNPLLARWMRNHHFRGPVTVIDSSHGFTPEVLRGWIRDRAAMTILMDQHTGRGSLLRFMGRPARTHTSAARLAIRTGCTVAVGSFVRTGPYRYRIVGDAPLRFARDADRDACAQLLNDRLEAAVRAYPEQYFWIHRRWRED